jgi:hypothetical protein
MYICTEIVFVLEGVGIIAWKVFERAYLHIP